jgi:hypothetical protein
MASQARSPTLDDEARRTIDQALQQLALGDAEGRRIFMLALSYELERLLPRIHEALTERERIPERSPSPRLDHLERSAEALRASLEQLEPDEQLALRERMTRQDRMGHAYDDDYFAALTVELKRLAAACAAELTPPRPAYTEIIPLLTLVALLAKAYSECLESEPEESVEGPFARLLATIFVTTGIRAPVTRSLIWKGLETRHSFEG